MLKTLVTEQMLAIRVDLSGSTPYLPAEMIRQLLTLVAILTGLSALGAPAQARVSAVDEVRVLASRDVVDVCSPVRAISCAVAAIPARSLQETGIVPSARSAPVVPAVMLRADRARE